MLFFFNFLSITLNSVCVGFAIFASFPNEVNAIDRYMDLLDKVRKASMKYFSTKALSGIPEWALYNYLSKEFFKYSDQTTYEVLSSLTSNLLYKQLAHLINLHNNTPNFLQL